MILKKVKVRNIRSYSHGEVSFPEGSILIAGNVGAGKSSLLMAIEYALFGLQPGQKGSSLLRNKNQIGEVLLELEIGGKQITIERKLKRSEKGVSNEYASITINGEKTESSITEIKSKIVDLLGYPPEFIKKNNVLYRFTVHSPQEQMKQIILEDPETRINILRNIFGVDRYKQIKANLATLIVNLKSDAKIQEFQASQMDAEKENLSVAEKKINLLQDEIKNSQALLASRSENKAGLERELDEFRKKIEQSRALLHEIEKTKLLIAAKREYIISLAHEERELQRIISEPASAFNEQAYQEIIEKTQEIKKELFNIQAREAEAAGRIKILKEERTKLQEKNNRLLKLKICPTCLQDVSDFHRHNIISTTNSELNSIEENLINFGKSYSEFNSLRASRSRELTELENKKNTLEISRLKQDEISKARLKLLTIEKQKQAFESDVVLLTQHIDALKEDILAYSVFENKYLKKELEVKQAAAEEKNEEILIASLKREKDLIGDSITLIRSNLEKKEAAKKKSDELNALIDWLSTQFLTLVELIERSVLFRLREEFTGRFQKWFSMLIPENLFTSRIDENFTPIIMQGDTEMDYQFLSGGERTAVALAYRLALNQIINSFMGKLQTRGIIILDEPTDGFSEAQIMRMRDVLDELNVAQLIIVSHEQKIEGFVDNIIRVSKDKDTSKIEQADFKNQKT